MPIPVRGAHEWGFDGAMMSYANAVCMQLGIWVHTCRSCTCTAVAGVYIQVAADPMHK